MNIETGQIIEAGNTVASDVIGDIDTLKGYFEGTEMLDLDGSGPTKVASKISETTQDWPNAESLVTSITSAAEIINAITVD